MFACSTGGYSAIFWQFNTPAAAIVFYAGLVRLLAATGAYLWIALLGGCNDHHLFRNVCRTDPTTPTTGKRGQSTKTKGRLKGAWHQLSQDHPKCSYQASLTMSAVSSTFLSILRPCTRKRAPFRSSNLLPTLKALNFPNDQHEGQRGEWSDTRMRHESLRFGALLHFLVDCLVQLCNRWVEAIQQLQ